MDTAAGFEFTISDADLPWWLETGVFYSVNGLQYHTTIYSPRRIIWLCSFPLVGSLFFMFIFVYYSAWNIPFEHLHLCIPRCDQTLIYKHLCIPRCIVYPLNIYLSKGCHNLSVTTYLVIVSIYLSIHLYIYWSDIV